MAITFLDNYVITPRQVLTTTLPTARETDLTSLALVLPTTEPGTPQISYTVQASDYPTYSAPVKVTHFVFIYASGRNNDGVTRTVSYRVKKNGASVNTGSLSVAASNYYTITTTNTGTWNIAVNDVMELALWSASSVNISLFWSALAIAPTRPILALGGATDHLLCDVSWEDITQWPTVTGAGITGASPSYTGKQYLIYASNLNGMFYSVATTRPLLYQKTYGLYTAQYGDLQTLGGGSASTTWPFCLNNSVPVTIRARISRARGDN